MNEFSHSFSHVEWTFKEIQKRTAVDEIRKTLSNLEIRNFTRKIAKEMRKSLEGEKPDKKLETAHFFETRILFTRFLNGSDQCQNFFFIEITSWWHLNMYLVCENVCKVTRGELLYFFNLLQ